MATRKQAELPELDRSALPRQAVDCHVHVFDERRYPFASGRLYTPDAAPLDALTAFLHLHGLDRVVLVQPSTYGDDNRCLLDALQVLGTGQARGIAVVNPAKTTDDELIALKAAGIAGIRINLAVKGEDRPEVALETIRSAITRFTPFGFILQIHCTLALIEGLEPVIATSPIPVVLDHFAGAKAVAGLEQPGMTALLRLLEAGKVWVKLSAPYRASALPDHADLAPIARTMIAANRERLVWASDWPHTGGGAARAARGAVEVEPFRVIDNRRLLDRLAGWAGDPATLHAILVENPARLFGFARDRVPPLMT